MNFPYSLNPPGESLVRCKVLENKQTKEHEIETLNTKGWSVMFVGTVT